MIRKLMAVIVCVTMISHLFSFAAFADYTDNDVSDVLFTNAVATWSMVYNPTADKNEKAATPITDKSNFAIGQSKIAAVYKVKLPVLQNGNAIDSAQFRMTSYYTTSRNVPFAYKMPGEDWDMDSLTVGDAQKIIDGNNLGKDSNFLSSCIEDSSFATTTTYRNRYDITDYVVECMEKGQKYMWIAVTRSSTVKAYPHDSTTEYWKPKLYYTVKASNVIDTPISKTQFETMLSETVNGGHPYLIGRKADFERVRKAISDGDGVIAAQYARIRQKADAYLKTAVKEIGNPSDSYLSIGFNSAWNIVPYCAFVYLMEGDVRFAERAYKEALYWAKLSSWGNYQYIDNTQAAMAVAICYDWLYDVFDEEQRAELKSALKTKHLNNVKEEYATGKTSGIARHLRGEHNHAVMNSATIFMQALAIADDDISYSAEIMANALRCLNTPLVSMYPDSGWREGMGYWHFVGPMIARLMMTMKASFGSCLGYENLDYVLKTGYFPIYSASSQGNFAVNDISSLSTDTSFDKYILGLIAKDGRLMKYSLENDELSHPFFCLAYDSQADIGNGEYEPLPKDKLFSESGLVSMRSSWDDDYELFAAMAVQPADKSHGHMNSGTIAFDALGERWITNPGGDDYSLDGYFNPPERWNYYATRAEANSCVVINPSSDGGQNPSSDDKIDTVYSSDTHSFATANLTDTYKGQVTSYKRGIGLFENKRRFVLQDEIVLTSSSDVYSFININEADITLLSDGCSAVMTKGDKKLHMSVICDKPYELEVMDSVPLSTSPDMSGQSSFENLKKIVIKVNDVSDVKLRVAFTPCLLDEELEFIKKDSYVDIKDWENTLPELDAEIDSVYVNGSRFDSFKGQSRIIDGIEYGIVEAAVLPGFDAQMKINPENNRMEIFVYDETDKTNNYSYVVYPSGTYSKYASGVYHVTSTSCDAVTAFSSDVSAGSQKMILFKIPVFKTMPGEKIGSAVMEFTAGVYDGAVTAENMRFKVYGFDSDFANISSVRYSDLMSAIQDENILPHPSIVADNCGYADSGAVYHRFKADVGDLAKKCSEEGRDYMYVGITTVNCNAKMYGTENRSAYPNCRPTAKYTVLSSKDYLTAGVLDFETANGMNQQLVSAPVISKTGTVSAKIRTVNKSSHSFNVNLFVATYTGNKLTGCRTVSVNAMPDTDKEWETPKISNGADAEKVKAFVWMPSGKPIASSTIE